MLIEDWRPKLYCKEYECQNLSPNKKVFFIEEGHKYYHEDDIVDGKLVPFEDSAHTFKSPTGIIGDWHDEFDTIPQAKKYVKKHKLPITYEQLIYGWEFLGDYASDQGTTLHAYGESLFNGWGMPRPDLHKAQYVDEIYRALTRKYVLSKTELLVYNTHLQLAGQVDLLMKNYDGSEYYILDWKFLKEPLEMKSFYNWRTRKFRMMWGPFNRLMDCNHSHYSIQMEIYRYLMGGLGKKVKKKQLMVVTPTGYSLVDGAPMKIWVDIGGYVQARYRIWNGSIYDSSTDRSYMENPYRLIDIDERLNNSKDGKKQIKA
jgi:hypothetical protein